MAAMATAVDADLLLFQEELRDYMRENCHLMEKFIQEKIFTINIMKRITDQQLKEMGFLPIGIRNNILNSITSFCENNEQSGDTKCNRFVKIWERKKKEVRAFSRFSKRKKVTSSDEETECMQLPSEKPESSKQLLIPDCKVFVGLVRFSSKKGDLIIAKQKKFNLTCAVLVNKDCSASLLKEAAIKQHMMLHEHILGKDREFELLYPSNTIVNMLPTGSTAFTPKRYRDLLGHKNRYDRLRLYLVAKQDFEDYCRMKTRHSENAHRDLRAEDAATTTVHVGDQDTDVGKDFVLTNEHLDLNEHGLFDVDFPPNMFLQADFRQDESEDSSSDVEVTFKGQSIPSQNDLDDTVSFEMCYICNKGRELSSNLSSPLSCQCIFHDECINEWLKVKDDIDSTIPCPSCRLPFSRVSTFQSPTCRLPNPADPGWTFRQVSLPQILNRNTPTKSSSSSTSQEEPITHVETVVDKEITEALLPLRHRRVNALEEIVKTTTNITIHRDTILDDMMKEYDDSSCLATKYPNFTFNGEMGEDLDGLKREAFSGFWNKAIEAYFDGSARSFIPRTGPDVTESSIRVLGRVAAHAYVTCGMFPVQICKIFSLATICGPQSVTNEDLLESFLAYHSDFECELLEKALNTSFGSGKEDKFEEDVLASLFDILSPYNLRSSLKPSSLKDILIATARCKFIHKISWATLPFKEGLSDAYPNLWKGTTKAEVNSLYAKLMPTRSGVMSLFTMDETSMTQQQDVVYGYLRRFIRNVNDIMLRKMLRFLTGSEVVAFDEIEVIFHTTIGSVPQIIAHTCGPVLDLPSSGYVSYNDFQCQLYNLLSNPLSWKFHLV